MRTLVFCFLVVLSNRLLAQANLNKITFDTPLEQLQDVRLKNNLALFTLHPSFDMSLEELGQLNFVKIAKTTDAVDFGFDLNLEELSQLEYSEANDMFVPYFGMDINTLSKLYLKKVYVIDSQLDFSYDLPLETLMKLSIVD